MTNGDDVMRDIRDPPQVERATFGQRISEFSEREFERFIQGYFDCLSYDTELTQATRDGGYDIYLSKPGIAKIVEVKHSNIGPNIIREVAGCALQHEVINVIVVALYFTDGAKDAAKKIEEHSHLTINLLSPNDLHSSLYRIERTDLIDEYGPERQERQESADSILESW